MIDYTEGSGKQYHTGVGPGDIGEYVILPCLLYTSDAADD